MEWKKHHYQLAPPSCWVYDEPDLINPPDRQTWETVKDYIGRTHLTELTHTL
jgi:hypothetical protein